MCFDRIALGVIRFFMRLRVIDIDKSYVHESMKKYVTR